MWSLIPNSKFEEFIQTYPRLDEFRNEVRLLTMPNSEYSFLPKFTYLYNPSDTIIKYTDPEFQQKEIQDVEFTAQLRDYQVEMLAPFINRYQVSKLMHGCLKANPGAGKTVMGIYLATLMKTVTLIMINNTALASQWKDTILNMTNIPEEKIGLIQGSTFDVEDKVFILSTVQTFCSKINRDVKNFYQKVRDVGIGFVLFDECHHSVSGPKYALSSLVLNTNNIVGLSATPFMTGLNEFLMTNTVGTIISDVARYDLKPKVTIIKYHSKLDPKALNQINRIRDLIMQRSKYNAIICNSEVYLDIIIKLNKYLLRKDHRIINIVLTKKQVESISQNLTLNDISNIRYFSEQRELDKTSDNCLVATYKFAGEGFDYKELSSLVLATPLSGRKSLIQIIGRILRSHPDKIQPECFIMVDTAINGYSNDINRICKIIQEEFKVNVYISDKVPEN